METARCSALAKRSGAVLDANTSKSRKRDEIRQPDQWQAKSRRRNERERLARKISGAVATLCATEKPHES